MEWLQLPLGAIQTNAYIIYNQQKDAVIIDPGDEFDKIKDAVETRGLNPNAILLTHAHFDHIGALDKTRDHWNIPVYLHIKESDWLDHPDKNGSAYFPMVSNITLKPADILIESEKLLTIGSFTFEILETPGHSPGSVSFYVRQENVIFSGDALFYGSIGRTDLYGGDQKQLLESIDSKLLVLPDETIVAPGHGFETTIKNERMSNPFF
ncbi:MBL fold metallo-hydrolase [Tuberibacillus sp. Marseille-P3662]|uniref:MBL fold metallo-hydrolase n=1 Tax=Tuberibacillus sp. Marseille-P3662 TaxID=1965358 RepID=UPI000A1CEC86|nr:MBL fold metallo-hydrolase [Tuberibacillus sp. Marseille-P3662]